MLMRECVCLDTGGGINFYNFGHFQYLLKAEMKRSLLNKDLQKNVEFIVEFKVRQALVDFSTA